MTTQLDFLSLKTVTGSSFLWPWVSRLPAPDAAGAHGRRHLGEDRAAVGLPFPTPESTSLSHFNPRLRENVESDVPN